MKNAHHDAHDRKFIHIAYSPKHKDIQIIIRYTNTTFSLRIPVMILHLMGSADTYVISGFFFPNQYSAELIWIIFM